MTDGQRINKQHGRFRALMMQLQEIANNTQSPLELKILNDRIEQMLNPSQRK